MFNNTSFSNIDLLHEIAESNEKAFNKLFEIYSNQLFTYLFSITKSNEIAEEATLDVFLKIWKGRKLLPQIINFDAFLFTVVQNKAIDYLRKAKNNILIQKAIWTEIENLVDSEFADQKLYYSETNDAINKAINKLPPQKREAFRLSREELLNYEEIAKKMQISKHTVRNHISSALQLLKEMLQNGKEIAFHILIMLLAI